MIVVSGHECAKSGDSLEMTEEDAAKLRAGTIVTWKDGSGPPAFTKGAMTRIGVPVVSGRVAWGWMFLESSDVHEVARGEGGFLVALGRETALLVQAASSWKAVRGALVVAMAGVDDPVDERGGRRRGRGKRVASIFRAAAGRAGLSSSDCDAAALAAHILSLGELGVPELVAENPTTLTPQERKHYEAHPDHAVRLLEPLLMIPQLKSILATWREWWDGTGYPHRLSGEKIPRAARLLAVCDALDEVVGAGQSKNDLDLAKAADFLRAGSGSVFDPKMVEAVLPVVDDEANTVLWTGEDAV